MSILEDLATKGVERAKTEWDKQGGKWFDDAIKSATETASKLDPNVKAGAVAGLEAIAKHKDELLHLGSEGLVAVIGFLAMGSSQRAEEMLFLREKADLATLLAASEASNAKVIAAKEAEAKAKKAVMDTLKDVTVTVAKTALPLLLSVI